MKINYKNEQTNIDIDAIDYSYHYVVGFIGEEPYLIKRTSHTGAYYWDSMVLDESIGCENFISNLVTLDFLKNHNITGVEVFEHTQDVFKYVYDYLSDFDSPADMFKD